MSEPKIAVAPPAGAVMMVTVFAFMVSRFGSVHVSSGLGMPSGRATCGAAVPHIMLIMITGRGVAGETTWLSLLKDARGQCPIPPVAEMRAKCGDVEAMPVFRESMFN